VSQHAGTFGFIKRVAVGRHFDRLHGVESQRDLAGLLQLERNLPECSLRDRGFSHISDFRKECAVIGRQRVIPTDADQLLGRLQRSHDVGFAQGTIWRNETVLAYQAEDERLHRQGEAATFELEMIRPKIKLIIGHIRLLDVAARAVSAARSVPPIR
jgi:hypothetical protein